MSEQLRATGRCGSCGSPTTRRRADRRRRQGAPRMVDGLAAVELASLLLDPTPEPPRRAATAGARARARRRRRCSRTRSSIAPATALEARARCRSSSRAPRAALAALAATRCRARGRSPTRCARRRRHRPQRADLPAPASRPAPRPLADSRHQAALRRDGQRRRARRRAPARVRSFLEARGQRAGAAQDDGAGERARRERRRASWATRSRSCSSTCRATSPTRCAPRAGEEEMGKRKRGGQPEGADRVLKALGYAPRPVQRALSQLVGEPAHVQPRGVEHPRPARAALHARLRARGGLSRRADRRTATRCRSA